MTDCLFCRIADGSLPADKVAETESLVAFRDINPQAPVHILVIPRRHVASTDALAATDGALVGEMILLAVELARREGVDATGYRLVLNCGEDGGQSVAHLHLHLLGGRKLRWPPG